MNFETCGVLLFTEDGDNWLHWVTAYSNKLSVKTNESSSSVSDSFSRRKCHTEMWVDLNLDHVE